MRNSNPEDLRAIPVKLAIALRDVEAAVIVDELCHYLALEQVGIFIDGVKYIENTLEFEDWVTARCPWWSPLQIRKIIKSLRKKGLIKVIRARAKQFNQTNHYTVDEERLTEILEG